MNIFRNEHYIYKIFISQKIFRINILVFQLQFHRVEETFLCKQNFANMNLWFAHMPQQGQFQSYDKKHSELIKNMRGMK